MCGRFTITVNLNEIKQAFDVDVPQSYRPNYNASPTQLLPIILDNNQKTVELVRWGLIPSWAKEVNIGYKMINARSETLLEKPSYRRLVEHKRCVIIADGFYEWKKSATKVPYRITLKNKTIFTFAGLWDTWLHEGKEIKTFTIITCPPTKEMREIHDRMPVILQDPRAWLDRGDMRLLLPTIEILVFTRVSDAVNSVKNNSEKLLIDMSMKQTSE